ncbi:hypothetical protein EV191_1011421 [Tamaricihabitans halophyticus]|uniref:Uncharacterized protein n=1 Tax=Tamaricihabitans halophyticus TaxID=1262583 RepID=A0A4R2RDI5_9PSEU|nr:DUF5946 family protein [Tamaricihabitans halophyticus]TCP57465.1 hypothetical protein EV191_1011421 [Tamaricihabitans halophyticus]
MTSCSDCGAAANCAELFDRLLALDHAREEPWGPLHSIVVACYFLQHPAAEADASTQWGFLQVYLRDGLAAVHARQATARRRNSHRHSGRSPHDGLFADVPQLPANGPARPFTMTIADVSAGGDFPAEGHTERVRAWAAATVAAWSNDNARTP